MTDKPLSFDPPSFNVACIQYYASADIDADINLAEQLIADAVAADPDSFNQRVPLGRMGATQEIADVAVFLASERAS